MSKHKVKVFDIPKDINNSRWLTVEAFCLENSLNADNVYMYKTSNPEFPIFRKDGKDVWVDANNITIGMKDFNAKRQYYFLKMYEEIYYGLTRYLNDYQIAKFMAKTHNTTVQPWVNFLLKHEPSMLSEKSLLFIKTGKHILDTKALYRNFKPKWEIEK